MKRSLITVGRTGTIIAAGRGQLATRIELQHSVELNGATCLLRPGKKQRERFVCDRLGRGLERVYPLTTRKVAELGASFHVTTYEGQPFAVVCLSLANRSRVPVALGNIHLLKSVPGTPLRIGGAVRDGTRFAHTNRTRGCYVQSIDRNVVAQGINLIYNGATGLALNTSFLTFDQAFSRIAAPYDSRARRLRGIDIRQPFGGFSFQPGEHLSTDLLYVEVSKAPQESLERYADHVARWYRTNPNTPVKVGWLGWATAERWFQPTFRETYEQQAKRNVLAIKRRLGGLGVDNVWISQANFHREIPMQWEKGKLENRTDFPKGFTAFAKWLRRKGVRLGLWVMLFRLLSTSEAIREHPEIVLKDKDGAWMPLLTKADACGTREADCRKKESWRWYIGRYSLLPHEKRPKVWILDPSHPQSQKWIEETLGRLTAGADTVWYMLDFLDGCNTLDADFHDRCLVPGVQP